MCKLRPILAVGTMLVFGAVLPAEVEDEGPELAVRKYLEGLQNKSGKPTTLSQIDRLVSVLAQPVSLSALGAPSGSAMVLYTAEVSVSEDYANARVRWLRQWRLPHEEKQLRGKPTVLARAKRLIQWSIDRVSARHWIVQGAAVVHRMPAGWQLANPAGVDSNLNAWLLDAYYEPDDRYR